MLTDIEEVRNKQTYIFDNIQEINFWGNFPKSRLNLAICSIQNYFSVVANSYCALETHLEWVSG